MNRALIIAPVYPLNHTEKEDYINIPAQLMRELGLEVEILTLARGQPSETIDGFKVRRFSNAISLFVYGFKQRPRLLHSNLRPYLPSMLAGLLPGKKVHTPMTDILGSNKIIKAVSIMLYKRYDKILAHTPYGKQLFLENGFSNEKVEMLPLPINFELFSKPKSTKGLQMLNVKGKPFIITCVANFRGIKGVDVLIHAFSMFRKEVKNTKLVLVGKDWLAEEGKPTIRQMVEELNLGKDVIQLGFLKGPDIKKVLDVSDVFCMASSIDAQCLSIYEASAASAALCLSNLPAFTSVFGDAALYHNVGDVDGLARDLLAYYKNPKLRKTNGIKGRKRGRVADYPVVHKKLKELYKSLLN